MAKNQYQLKQNIFGGKNPVQSVLDIEIVEVL